MLRLSSIILLVLLAVVVHASVIPIPSQDAGRRSDKHMHPDDSELPPKLENYKRNVDGEDTTEYWLNQAKNFVAQKVNITANKKVAKNVIFFLGDGMSVTTLAAARAFMGGEEVKLSFEEFPVTGMVKTYCVNYQVSDSASTATAYLSGVKANYATVGVSAKVARYSCTDQLDTSTHTTSIGKWALDAGKSAGFVTTSSVTDASPASLYAHSADRYWENDDEVVVRGGCDPKIIDDIAEQMMSSEVSSKFSVILGGGRRHFRDYAVRDEQSNSRGFRRDKKNLINTWIQQRTNQNASYVWNTNDLLNVNAAETDTLLGLFAGDGMTYRSEVLEQGIEDEQPSLTQMLEKAIDILSKNENGFFLFVENDKIDTAHHGTYTRIALHETAELSKAVEYARNRLGDEDTLIIVSSDHSHTLSYSGYPYRGTDIFGAAGSTNEDKKTYLTMGYANGRGYENHMNVTSGGRQDPSLLDTTPLRFRFPSTVSRSTESHAGEDVAVFASGPWSHLFNGVYEQSAIPYKLAYASCIGSGILSACDV